MTRHIIVIWLFLVVATAATGLFAASLLTAGAAVTAMLLVAIGKIYIVIRYFMEVERRHKPLANALSLWLAAVCAITVGGYWVA